MPSPRAIAATIVAGLILWLSGISINGVPDHELAVLKDPPLRSCHDGTCIAFYRLVLGNTGWEMQEQVKVVFNKHLLDMAIIPLKARNFGKTIRMYESQEREDMLEVDLGRLDRGMRVELQAAWSFAPGEQPPTWEDLVLTVSTSRGQVVTGMPEIITFSRFLYWYVS